jgi:uncharacterized protein DUF4157
MSRREQPVGIREPSRSNGQPLNRGSPAPARTGPCGGAAAQLAALRGTLRHGPALQLQAGGAAANRTGLPDRLKAGVEALSGVSLDGVKVHYNSAKPAQLNALAYAQGSDIHLGPGQEAHLPHEAWHVVQQAQGRVKPTAQMRSGVAVNDERGLEREADVMGARAAGLELDGLPPDHAPIALDGASSPVFQLVRNVLPRPREDVVSLVTLRADLAAVRTEIDNLEVEEVAIDRANLAVRARQVDEHIANAERRFMDAEAFTYNQIDTVNREGFGDLRSAWNMLTTLVRDLNASRVPPPEPPAHKGEEPKKGAGAGKEEKPPAALDRIARHAVFRHGAEEGGRIEALLAKHKPKSAEELRALIALLNKGDKADRRSAYLLAITLSDLDIMRAEDVAAADPWAELSALTGFILHHAPSLNAGEAGPAHAGLEDGKLLKLGPNRWHAAAVAALRTQGLSQNGLLRLNDILTKLNAPIDITSGDVMHELMLQARRLNEKGARTGAAAPPSYGAGKQKGGASSQSLIAGLNQHIGTFDASGSYAEAAPGVVGKTLDKGHKITDMWENVAHRNKKTIAPDVKFDYLALLSPNEHQQAVGANGAILGDGNYMFVVDLAFRFRYMPAANYVGEGDVNKNFVQFIPHSQLAGLADVLAAGNFMISGGKFVWIDNGSGHYRVDGGVNKTNATQALRALGYAANMAFFDRRKKEMDKRYQEGNQILDVLKGGRPGASPEMASAERAMVDLARQVETLRRALPARRPQQQQQQMGAIVPRGQRLPAQPGPDIVRDPVSGQYLPSSDLITNEEL